MCVTIQAATYVRQSEFHSEGIERAQARCKALVEIRRWELVTEYADNAVSASKSRADAQWSKMLADAKAGKFAVLVGVDMDRLVRSIQDLGALVDLGIKVLTVDGEIDLTTADGEFRATMLAAIARFEVRRKAERQVRGNEWRVAQGLPVPGKRRFGYLTGNIVAHPEEGPILTSLFTRVLAGESVFSLAKELGKPPVRVRELLSNRSYVGFVQRRGEWYKAAPSVARLVDPKVFDAVQTLLADPSRKTSPGSAIRHLASGIARCGVCNARMVKQGPNYLCKGNLGHPTIKAALLDDHLKWEAFSYVAGLTTTPREEVLALVTNLTHLTRARTVQQDMATWEGADLAAIRVEVARLGKEIERTEVELAQARSDSVAEDVAEALRSELPDDEGAQWWEKRWEQMGLEDQRTLIAGLNIKVFNGRGLDRVKVSVR